MGGCCSTASQDEAFALRLFQELDKRLIQLLLEGRAVRLLRADLLRGGELTRVERRQDLEALERSGTRVFLQAHEVAALLMDPRRQIGVLTYGWATPLHPDPEGVVLANVCTFLRSPHGQHITAVFMDFASLPQKPRDSGEERDFQVRNSCPTLPSPQTVVSALRPTSHTAGGSLHHGRPVRQCRPHDCDAP